MNGVLGTEIDSNGDLGGWEGDALIDLMCLQNSRGEKNRGCKCFLAFFAWGPGVRRVLKFTLFFLWHN